MAKFEDEEIGGFHAGPVRIRPFGPTPVEKRHESIGRVFLGNLKQQMQFAGHSSGQDRIRRLQDGTLIQARSIKGGDGMADIDELIIDTCQRKAVNLTGFHVYVSQSPRWTVYWSAYEPMFTSGVMAMLVADNIASAGDHTLFSQDYSMADLATGNINIYQYETPTDTETYDPNIQPRYSGQIQPNQQIYNEQYYGQYLHYGVYGSEYFFVDGGRAEAVEDKYTTFSAVTQKGLFALPAYWWEHKWHPFIKKHETFGRFSVTPYKDIEITAELNGYFRDMYFDNGNKYGEFATAGGIVTPLISSLYGNISNNYDMTMTCPKQSKFLDGWYLFSFGSSGSYPVDNVNTGEHLPELMELTAKWTLVFDFDEWHTVFEEEEIYPTATTGDYEECSSKVIAINPNKGLYRVYEFDRANETNTLGDGRYFSILGASYDFVGENKSKLIKEVNFVTGKEKGFRNVLSGHDRT